MAPAEQLAFMYANLLGQLEKFGVQIHAVIADGLNINRQFFKIISMDAYKPGAPYVSQNPYAADRCIFLCSDPSHLLKVDFFSLLH